MKGVLFLAIAIVSEVFGTTMLKLSDGFTEVLPTVGVGAGFVVAFTSLSFALKSIPLSTAYATWSGIGTALTALVGAILFQEIFTPVKLAGLFLVIFGIVLLNASTGEATGSAKPKVKHGFDLGSGLGSNHGSNHGDGSAD